VHAPAAVDGGVWAVASYGNNEINAMAQTAPEKLCRGLIAGILS